ncbi:YdhR family protein [Oceanibaculum nanhaiense]|uniref:YdhR family protein n=1 Tax=Oceanibaculum nanhaiense TaxID=1909734 RepID=UPI00396E1F7B
MITVITRFPQPTGKSQDELKGMFRQSAPRFQTIPGLVRKYYYIADDNTCGGVYLFRSRAEAETLFDDAFAASIMARFGAPPRVEFLETPVIVDNDAGTILGGDEGA